MNLSNLIKIFSELLAKNFKLQSSKFRTSGTSVRVVILGRGFQPPLFGHQRCIDWLGHTLLIDHRKTAQFAKLDSILLK